MGCVSGRSCPGIVADAAAYHRSMKSLGRWLLRGIALLIALLVVVLAWRAYDAMRAPKLELWHTFVPDEAPAEQIDKLDWAGYLAAEKTLFEQVRSEVTDKLDEEDRVESNRYYSGSPLYPGRFAQDWNRSYVLLPSGTPRGAMCRTALPRWPSACPAMAPCRPG
jgi:hypothetical protein